MPQASDLNAELHDAIGICDKDRVERLIKEGADVELRNNLVALLVEVGKLGEGTGARKRLGRAAARISQTHHKKIKIIPSRKP